ncbi:MAG: hypothetical protein KDC87_03515 [Planctomycetes bacterium]|nr:hypothetical protein [Planctomycetota bacterium]
MRRTSPRWVAACTLAAAVLAGGCARFEGLRAPELGQAERAQQQVVPARPATPPFPVPVGVPGDEMVVSGPFRHENLAVFLIRNPDEKRTARKVLTLEEAMAQKKVEVHETGEVQQLTIRNLDPDVDIFVQSGDIVRGGKQDRVLQKDLLLSAKAGHVPLESFCVESGRWNYRSELGAPASVVIGCGASPDASFRWDRFVASSNSLATNELKRAVRVAKDQREVWSEVAKVQNALAGKVARRGLGDSSILNASGSLELSLSDAMVRKAASAYEKALLEVGSGQAHVVGFAITINGRLNSAEGYATSDLFSRLWPKLLKAAAIEAVAKKPEKAAAASPTSVDRVRDFLAIPASTQGFREDVDGRIRLVTADGASKFFAETRDRDAGFAWVHRLSDAK